MTSSLNVRLLGLLPTGEPVEAWTLTGASGLVLEVITYGGIVTKLLLPNGEGHWVDVVLGLSGLDSYVASRLYFGAIVGRVAGRINNARFHLDGRTYQLARNDPPNHLHGGVSGFDKKVWNAAPAIRRDGAPSLQLSYCSPDGDEGYPGTVNVSVTYTVAKDNSFVIDTMATTNRSTPFSLTHHSYFNLAGEGSGSIKNHALQIDADECIGTDDHLTLLDKTELNLWKSRRFSQPQAACRCDPAAYAGSWNSLPCSQITRRARTRPNRSVDSSGERPGSDLFNHNVTPTDLYSLRFRRLVYRKVWCTV